MCHNLLPFIFHVTIPGVSSVKDFYCPQHFVFPHMVVIFILWAIPFMDHREVHIRISKTCQSNSQTLTTLYPLLLLVLSDLQTWLLLIWLCPQDNQW